MYETAHLAPLQVKKKMKEKANKEKEERVCVYCIHVGYNGAKDRPQQKCAFHCSHSV